MAFRTSQFRTPEPASLEMRQVERHPVVIQPAFVRRRRTRPLEARLQDLSIYGCRLACEASHEPEERVVIRICGGMPIGATVIWSKDGMIGCRFDAPIASGTVRALTLGI